MTSPECRHSDTTDLTARARRAFAAVCALLALAAFPAAPRAQERHGAAPQEAPEVNRRLAELAFGEAERLRALWTADSLRGATAKYEESLRRWRLAGEAAGEAAALNAIGDVLYSVGDSAGALEHYHKALSSSRSAADRRGQALSLNNVCYAQAFVGETKKALDSCNEALALSRALADGGLVGQSLGNLGKVYYSLSDMGRALELFAEALPLLRAAGSRQKEAQALLNQGYTHASLSDVTRAIACYQEALPVWREANDRRGEALTLSALGHLYNKLEEKQKALGLYDEALRLFRMMGDRYGEANALNGIAFIYNRLGERASALDYYQRSLRLYRLTNRRTGQALALIACGGIYSESGDYRNALDSFQQALALSRDLADPLVESYVLGYLGKLFYAQGDAGKALEYYGRALEFNRKGKDAREEAYTLNNIGYVRSGMGEREAALECFRQALKLNEQVKDPGGASLSYYNIARVERERGNLSESRAAIESALKISEDLRTKVTSRDLRATYFATVQQQFELYIDVLMRLHGARPGEGFEAAAFAASERSRARSLLETIPEARANVRQGVDAETLRRVQELQRRINAKAERRIQLAAAKASAEALAAAERELSDLTADYQQLEGQLRASSPRYAELMRPTPLAPGEIQRKVLDADTLLLEYALGEGRSFVWAVTPDSIKGFELPPRAEVEKAARRVYELLTTRNRRAAGETERQWLAGVRRAEAEYVEASAALGRMLLGPVAAELGKKRLVVVADGALQYVSFAALPAPVAAAAVQTEASFVPLIVEHEVVVLPSASVLALTREELRERRPAPKSVAVLADPIFDGDDERLASAKGARARVRAEVAAGGESAAAAGVARRAVRGFDGLDDGAGIARLLFSRREATAIMASVPAAEGMLALGFRASRATAMSPELSQYRIVHFATHGLLNSENPELSGVILSRFDEAGRPQDGFLASYEIYNLDLPAELVVLSACQTALGKEVRGEGLVGLTRGFMYAGARRVVASLWKVDDSATAELMGQFYREMLGKGLRPAEALRAAQRHMWQQQRWRSPYYWAAFTLQGEWR